jgi:hypothetical protein
VHFQGFDHTVEDEADLHRGDKESNDANWMEFTIMEGL